MVRVEVRFNVRVRDRVMVRVRVMRVIKLTVNFTCYHL